MRLLVIAVCLSVSFALDCPKHCSCVHGDELEYFCPLETARVIYKARINDYVTIDCEGTNFTCADLPVINFANDMPLRSLAIKGCSPSLLECVPSVLRASSVSFLTVKSATAPLQAQHVAGLGAVHDIMLVRSPEETIPVSVVHALPSLRTLRINGANLTLESNVFNNLTQLEFLELSESQITEIPEDAFKGLSSLHILNIWGNNISEIGVNSFRGLDSLQKLGLITNHISTIPAGALAHVPKLQSISLFKNQLKELPPGLLHNLTQLENITIKYNTVPLKLHKHSLSNLPSLKNLIIENSSTDLPEELLIGCDELQTISLSGNMITSLPFAIFKDLKHLKRLDLSRNRISALNSNDFSPLLQLEYLNLNRNHLEFLPDFLFSGMRKLNYVSIDDNFLTKISPQAFLGAEQLQTISLKSNRLTLKSQSQDEGYFNFDEYSPFNTLVQLKNLYLNGNQISTMFTDWGIVLTKLEHLDLTRNNFTMLHTTDCQFVSNDIIVDLRHNSITNVILSPGTVTAGDPMGKASKSLILLDDNPLECDCRLYNLAMRLKGAKLAFVSEPNFDLGNAKCASPMHLKGDLFVNVSPENLNCDLEPENCYSTCSTCEMRPAKADLSLDCKTIPPSLPNPEEFGAKSLSLRLRTAPKTIEHLNLQLLNLSNIGLEEIAFSPSKSVEAIDFSNNNLTEIPMQFLKSNITLYLSNNPFECDCWHSKELQALKVSETVKDVGLVNCGDKLLSLIEPLELCNTWQAAVVASGTFIILVIIVAIITTIIYKNSREIIVFIINHGLCPCCFVDDPDDINKEYDVFVSYAHKDRQYLETIMPKLENDFGLKTCVHYRDWYVGDFIPDQINRSVEKSRKTIILLSNNFLDSAYANMEFRAAHNLALKEGKNRIILILLEDVAKHKKLSEELKAHMKMNTFLKWEDSRFTEKLQRAVPLRNNKKFVWPDVFKQTNEKNNKSGLDVQLNSEGQLVNVAVKNAV